MWNYYPRAATRPKPILGKERMKFGNTWWGKKWVESVEGIGDPQRMSRGRSYARANRAFNIDIKSSKVAAKVEGSHGDYNLTIRFSKISGKSKDKLISTLTAKPDLLGAILNNEMPTNLEEASGVTLLPAHFISNCSCPDNENPCKHIAAVFYVLATEIDAAPQILFKLHGIDKNDILHAAAGTLSASDLTSSPKKKVRQKNQNRWIKQIKRQKNPLKTPSRKRDTTPLCSTWREPTGG